MKFGDFETEFWAVPHATPGMVLRWVQHADGPRQSVRQNEPDAFFALITKPERPVTLGFEHPWQVPRKNASRHCGLRLFFWV